MTEPQQVSPHSPDSKFYTTTALCVFENVQHFDEMRSFSMKTLSGIISRQVKKDEEDEADMQE